MENLWNDLRYAIRNFAKSPAFTIVAVLILALGIGATTAIFSVVNAVLVRPLPYKDPSQLIAFSTVFQSPSARSVFSTVTVTNVEAWREHSRTLQSIGSFTFTQMPFTVVQQSSDQQSFNPVAAAVDPELLPTLGVTLAIGSNFSGSGTAQLDRSAIISHKLWATAFNSDPSVIGRIAKVNGEAYTVIGILPPTFQFPRADASYFSNDVDLLIPNANLAANWGKDSFQWFVVARLAPGSNVNQAELELNGISSRIAPQPKQGQAYSVRLTSLSAETTRHVRPALLLMLGISLVLLLIACTNIMSLLFSRAAARGREMAVRKAMGASTSRLIRQLLTESVCLTFFSGALGILLANWGLTALVSLSPFHLPVTGKIEIDFSVLGFSFLICAAAALIAGLIPALHTGFQDEDLLRGSGTRASGGRVLRNVQRSLMVTQIALGLALLSGAGLLVNSLWRLNSIDPGFRTTGVLGFEVSVPSDHPRGSGAQIFQNILDATRNIPGVTSVGLISNLPPESRKGMFMAFSIVGQPAAAPGTARPTCNRQVTSEDYFQTMAIPLVRGRDFTAADAAGTAPVGIINETLARRYFPNQDPIGQKIASMFDPTPREIVGVIKTVHDRGLASDATPTLYVPVRQYALGYGAIVVRANVPPQSLIPEIRGRITKLDPGIPTTAFQTLDERVHQSLGEPRFYTVMATACALMAVLFVTLGLYGVISYSVSRRTAELGIRMALGAQRGLILRMVLLQGLSLAVIGSAIGIALSLFMTRILAALLFEIKPNDPATLTTATALIVAVTLFATYIPARRASRVDPMIALRYE